MVPKFMEQLLQYLRGGVSAIVRQNSQREVTIEIGRLSIKGHSLEEELMLIRELMPHALYGLVVAPGPINGGMLAADSSAETASRPRQK